MKNAKMTICLVVVCVMAVANFASADTIRGIGMDFVTIGNARNAADTQVMSDNTTGYGSVGYNYRIGKYEVTNAQWNTFTAAVGAPTGNDGGYAVSADYTGAQQPTNCVSWYEGLQFCNYLTSGDKSKGVYLFSGNNANPGDFQGINRTAAQTAYGTIYVIPTENEWYKAAYYTGSGYSTYANGTNIAPVAGVNSNYDYLSGNPWNVGSGTMEQNGTFDMMGNVWEWNEALFYSSYRGFRGGSYGDGGRGNETLASFFRYGHGGGPYYEHGGIVVGFRVASIPEPCSLVLLGLGGLVLRGRKK